jgi:hypothetical protein
MRDSKSPRVTPRYAGLHPTLCCIGPQKLPQIVLSVVSRNIQYLHQEVSIITRRPPHSISRSFHADFASNTGIDGGLVSVPTSAAISTQSEYFANMQVSIRKCLQNSKFFVSSQTGQMVRTPVRPSIVSFCCMKQGIWYKNVLLLLSAHSDVVYTLIVFFPVTVPAINASISKS